MTPAKGLLLVLLAILPHLPSLRGGFHSDDEGLIRDNQQLATAQGLREIWAGEGNPDYWPLTYTGFWVERQLWGENPLPYHITMLLGHAACTLLLFSLLRRLAVPGAWAAAALWAIHPATVDTVAWLIELKNLLCLFFALLSIHAYLDFEEGKGRTRLVWALAAFALSFLSKSALVVLPAVLFLLRPPRKWATLAPFLALAAICTAVTLRFQGQQIAANAGESLDFLQRVGLAARNACFYLGKTFFPRDLCFEYPRIDPTSLDFLWLFLLLALAASFLWWHRRGKSEGTAAMRGLGIYLLCLLPALGFVDLYFFRFSFVADRWQYFALPVPIILVCAALTKWLEAKGRQSWAPALFAVAVLPLGMLTWQRASLYESSTLLWEDTLYKNPAAAMSHAGLGHEKMLLGKIEEAAAHFGEAVRLQPRFLDAADSLALALESLGKLEEAEKVWKELRSADPNFMNANFHFARFLIERERPKEAIPLLDRNLTHFPNWPEGQMLRGACALETGDIERAAAALFQAQFALQGSGDLHFYLGELALSQGGIESARRHWQQAQQLAVQSPRVAKRLAQRLSEGK